MAVSITPTRLTTGLIPRVAAPIYAAPIDAAVTVLDASLFNASDNPVVYSIWVPVGGGPNDGNVLVKDLTIAANTREEFSALQGVTLNAGYEIYAVCDTANVLTLISSGSEFRRT